MRWFHVMLAAGLALLAVPAFAAPVTYTFDPGHTQVRFCWNHFGFSNPCANMNTIKGALVYDAQDPALSSVRVTMPMSGLDTHVPALNMHLKEADFFNAAQFPDITYRSTKVIPGTKPGDLTIEGLLTAHGVTQPVTLHAHLNKIGEQPMLHVPAIGFNATTSIERSAFGVGAYVPMVSDAVHVSITVEADARKPAGMKH
ncbi:Lipid/polyisoprenoid-binding, YceI-like protein [mine drainage metagenome]|uniref:Lipid/polyisoprenoid-binding, YceI-like protein n=2 Tax=mine drainage metagenome TaxID=410659 RepID=T0YVQ1_9ZZZZ